MDQYSVKINIEGNWYEYTGLKDGFKRSIKLYNSSLKPCLNSCSVKVRFSETLWQLLLTTDKSLPVAIEKNGGDFFVGVIPATLKDKIKKVQSSISLSVMDYSNILKEKIDSDICYNGYKVCDPEDKGNSIVHQLLYAGGYSDDQIYINDIIPEVITVFSCDEGEKTYWKLLEALLYEYHYAFNSDFSGRFTLVNWGVKSIIPLATIGDSGKSLIDLSINKKDRKYSSVETTWFRVKTLENTLIYRVDIDTDDVGEAILSGFTYPSVSDGEEVEQNYSTDWIDGDNPTILYTNNHALDIVLRQLSDESTWETATPEYESAENVLIESTFDIKKAQIILTNNNTETVWLTWFDIRADVTAKIKEVVTRSSYNGTTKEVKADYIETEEAASDFTTALDSYYKYCDTDFAFSSLDDLVLDGEYNIKFARASLSTTVRILERVDTTSNIIKYKAVPVSKLTSSTVTTKEFQDESSTEAMIQRAVTAATSNRPTFNQLISGHDTYGMTTTPFQLENVTTESHLNCIEISWSKQANLSNLSAYRLQISKDGVSWYSLGSEGLGELDEYISTQNLMYLHTGIPASSDGENAVPTEYYYRVAQVTVLNVVSDWSEPVLGATALVEGDVLAKDSIRSNHVKAGEITATHLDIETIDANTIGLLGNEVNPGVEMMDNSIHWSFRNSSRSNTGGKLSINCETKQSGKSWESEGQDNVLIDLDNGFIVEALIYGGDAISGDGDLIMSGDSTTVVEYELYGGKA